MDERAHSFIRFKDSLMVRQNTLTLRQMKEKLLELTFEVRKGCQSGSHMGMHPGTGLGLGLELEGAAWQHGAGLAAFDSRTPCGSANLNNPVTPGHRR